MRTRFFIARTVGYVLVLGAQVGGIQQLVKLVEDRTDARDGGAGDDPLAGTSVVARLAGGRIVARLPMAGFTVGLAAVQAVGLVALAFAEPKLALFAAIILFGATIGNILMLQPLLIAERFGVLDYPRHLQPRAVHHRARRGRRAAAARVAVRQRRRLPHVVHRRRVLLAGRRRACWRSAARLPCAAA